jgi:hypothetical protein
MQLDDWHRFGQSAGSVLGVGGGFFFCFEGCKTANSTPVVCPAWVWRRRSRQGPTHEWMARCRFSLRYIAGNPIKVNKTCASRRQTRRPGADRLQPGFHAITTLSILMHPQCTFLYGYLIRGLRGSYDRPVSVRRRRLIARTIAYDQPLTVPKKLRAALPAKL